MTRVRGWTALFACAALALCPAARATYAQEPTPAPGVIVGTVTDTALRAIAAAEVVLSGIRGEVVVRSSAAGRFRFTDVPAGAYRLSVRQLGFKVVSASIEVPAGDTLRLALDLEPANQALGMVLMTGFGAVPADSESAVAILHVTCGAGAATRGEGLLGGVVRDAAGKPLESVAITVEWRAAASDPSGRAAPSGDQAALGAFSDAFGHWHVCGVPLATPVTIRAAADEGLDEHTATLSVDRPFARIDLTPRTFHDGGAVARTPRASALVVFAVVNQSGAPVPDVTLEVVPVKGPSRQVATDSAGRALIAAVEVGGLHVRTRRIGYRPGELFVAVEEGRNTVPIILDAARVPMLSAVRIIGDREVLPRHQEFEQRRILGQTTATITAADIEKRNPVETWQMLSGIPAVRVSSLNGVMGSVTAQSTRGPRLVRKGRTVDFAPCWYRVMIDGVALPDSAFDLSRLPPPSTIHGIEVFGGGATIPPQYNSVNGAAGSAEGTNTCGLIAVWTK